MKMQNLDYFYGMKCRPLEYLFSVLIMILFLPVHLVFVLGPATDNVGSRYVKWHQKKYGYFEGTFLGLGDHREHGCMGDFSFDGLYGIYDE